MGEAGQSAVGQNKNDGFLHRYGRKSIKTAGENAKIELIADEANEFGEFWNQLILDTKTGEVKTNAQEAVNEVASSEKGWNQLIYASKTQI